MDYDINKGYRYGIDYFTVPSLERVMKDKQEILKIWRDAMDAMRHLPINNPDVRQIIQRANARFNEFLAKSDEKYDKLILKYKMQGWL